MKKFLVLTCMIACLFGMTACSGEEQLTEYEQIKVNDAITKAELTVIPIIKDTLSDPSHTILHEYTSEEVESKIETIYVNEEGTPYLKTDGNAFVSAVDSFEATYEEMGGYGEITGSTAKIDGKQIIVNVDIDGENCDATAEIIFSNDFFLKLESASLSKVSTFEDSMAKAGLNTVLGMGTVFAVLILISLIISCLGLVSKFQSGEEKKSEAKDAPKAEPAKAVENAVAQIVAQEEGAVADDTELIAVIAAAIAASQGATSTDGFVVRSIKRRRA